MKIDAKFRELNKDLNTNFRETDSVFPVSMQENTQTFSSTYQGSYKPFKAHLAEDEMRMEAKFSETQVIGSGSGKDGLSAYEIAVKNGFKGSEQEWLASLKGDPGGDGVDGLPGNDGITPHIGVNENWWIGETDTGIPATGPAGNQGLPGKDGEPGYTPVKGVDYFDGLPGDPGKDGYTPVKGVDYFDGQPGKDGTPGADGQPGKDGYSPVRGKDYWTDADKTTMVNEVIASIGEQSKVISYTRPTSIALKSGMQFLCYGGGNGGTFTFLIGGKEFKYTSKSTNDCGWFIWVQTATTAGSVVTPGGTRTYLNPIEAFEKVPVSYDGSGSYIVITIG